MLFPYTSSAPGQDSPALPHTKEVPVEAASATIGFAGLYNGPQCWPAKTHRAAGSQPGTSCHQLSRLCRTRTLHKECPAGPGESQQPAERARPSHAAVLQTQTCERFTSHPSLLPTSLHSTLRLGTAATGGRSSSTTAVR